MVTRVDNIVSSNTSNIEQQDLHRVQIEERVGCSIGIMAYNEEANIARTIAAVLKQEGPSIRVEEVIVVASGCTDRTVPTVAEIALKEPRVRLYVQEKREGKASAINLFLKETSSEVAILVGADVIPEESAIEHLCSPFLDPKVGMTGGRPVPINDASTFMGHSVHLLWRLHDRLARTHAKLGEIIAFRTVVPSIPANSAVDEISIQAIISQLDYQLQYRPECVVYNKGPVNVRDFLKQRRRIYAGHLKVRAQQNYEASTMKASPILRQLIACRDFTMSTPKQAMWTAGTILLEGFARMQGHYDFWRKREHHIWQMVDSTKDLEAGQRKMRRICNAQSVLVFRFTLEDASGAKTARPPRLPVKCCPYYVIVSAKKTNCRSTVLVLSPPSFAPSNMGPKSWRSVSSTSSRPRLYASVYATAKSK